MARRVAARQQPLPFGQPGHDAVQRQHVHARAEIDRAAREQRRSDRQRAAADGRIRWRVFRSAGQVRQLERMRVNRHAPLLGERLDVARVIEMAVREDDRQRRAAEQRLAGSTDRPREAREAGVDEHPGAARGVTHEVRVDHERSQPIHVARHRFSSHGSPPLFAPVHEQRACRAIITAEEKRPMTRAKVISATASLVAAVWLSTALAQMPAPPRFKSRCASGNRRISAFSIRMPVRRA